ncbi:MAG: 5-formyltetrahydrofolate cyclo-ligase [Candidatus Omnitrophota bacterium]|nr:5-formyltetrahydrofolate cyclo-ligase [Candidatus Omnitrophota bacterium]
MVYNTVDLQIKGMKIRKQEIRKEMIRCLREQESSLREERSLNIQLKLLSSEVFKTSKTVMTYVSLPMEVDTHYLIEQALKQGKRVVVPYIGPHSQTITASEIKSMNNLEKGPLNIFQPKKGEQVTVALTEIDLIIVPAVAYDKKNMRLGRGKGFYDKFLSDPDVSSVKTIGFAFDFQVVDSLPVDSYDRPVTSVITN